MLICRRYILVGLSSSFTYKFFRGAIGIDKYWGGIWSSTKQRTMFKVNKIAHQNVLYFWNHCEYFQEQSFKMKILLEVFGEKSVFRIFAHF